jgi:hypothetical protein
MSGFTADVPPPCPPPGPPCPLPVLQDVLVTLLNNLKVQERQNRVCTTVAIAIVAETCAPFTVLPALMNEYKVRQAACRLQLGAGRWALGGGASRVGLPPCCTRHRGGLALHFCLASLLCGSFGVMPYSGTSCSRPSADAVA